MLNRREAMLRLGQVGLGALTLPSLLQAQRVNGAYRGGRAKSVILLYLWGGPPQHDMWDMKPDAPVGMRSLFEPIATAVPGIQICDQMPQLAQHTDKIAFIRSMTHSSNVHEPSVYYSLTGKQNNTLISPRNQRNRSEAPNIGAILSALTPPARCPPA